MENENNNVVENPSSQSNENYIEAIKKLKENSVSKEKYNALEAENKRLVDAIVEGKEIDLGDSAPDEGESIEDLRKELLNEDSNLTDLQFCEKMLQLRDKIIEQGGEDPMLPNNGKVTAEDIDGVEKVVAAMKDAIEIADGNSEVFKAKLMSMTVDNPIVTAMQKAKANRRK